MPKRQPPPSAGEARADGEKAKETERETTSSTHARQAASGEPCTNMPSVDDLCSCLMEQGTRECESPKHENLVNEGLAIIELWREDDQHSLHVAARGRGGWKLAAPLAKGDTDSYSEFETIEIKRIERRKAGPAQVVWIETAKSSASTVPSSSTSDADNIVAAFSHVEYLTICVLGGTVRCPVSEVPLRGVDRESSEDSFDKEDAARIIRKGLKPYAKVTLESNGSVTVATTRHTPPYLRASGDPPPTWAGRFDLVEPASDETKPVQPHGR